MIPLRWVEGMERACAP